MQISGFDKDLADNIIDICCEFQSNKHRSYSSQLNEGKAACH